jgi:hypothetical protein
VKSIKVNHDGELDKKERETEREKDLGREGEQHSSERKRCG